MASYAVVLAANTQQSVAQVTEPVSLTADVDYHITGTEPFTSSGSIDIVNTEHAVVILDALKPSKAKAFLSYIKINGAAAKDGTNCQLKLYNKGAIVLPYGGSTFRPLTVFDGDNFEGESYNTLTEGSSGGYMKNMPTAWNNRVRSFKLKRGYMVTFALKKGGSGYSRCFIAANSDLEMTLPALMAGRISSYRIFKWYDAGKAQLANAAGDKTSLALLNVQSTYDWGQGNTSLQPDIEWVPNHIYEDWPSSSTIGGTTQSPHTKNNNEPRNEGDDHPQDLATILNNWENMMRTGLRLCSPASWDGSDYWNATGFLAEFLDSIDARGWRCDIIDLHCYWPEGNFGNVTNWANKYKRPIWISEWCWGASWSGNGSFSGSATESSFANAIKNITTTLNSNTAVERYYYWNGENGSYPCKLTRDGALTQAGEYYASMTTPLAYSGYGNYVPKAPRLYAISDLDASFTPRNSTCTLTWTSRNGDLTSTLSLQRRLESGAWETLQEWTGAELEDKTSMSYKDVVETPGSYTYRIVEKMYDNSTKTSNLAYNNLATAEGTEVLQHGVVSANVGDESYIYFLHPFDEANEPIVVFGSPTNRNSSVGIVDNLMAINSVSGNYAFFRYRMNKWASDEATSTTKKDESTFIAAKPGHGKIGRLAYEAAYFDNSTEATDDDYLGFTPTEVCFKEPFETVPVVMVQPLKSMATAKPIMWRVWDVTTEGFKAELMLESNITTGKTACRLGYIAIEKGQGTDGEATLYTVGDTTLTFKTAQQTIVYPRALDEPTLMAQLQSFDYDAAAILRTPSSNSPETDGRVRMQVDKSNTAMTLSSTRSATERVGYIVVSKASEEDIANDKQEPDAVRYLPEASSEMTQVYDLAGRRTSALSRGVYIINGKKVVVK